MPVDGRNCLPAFIPAAHQRSTGGLGQEKECLGSLCCLRPVTSPSAGDRAVAPNGLSPCADRAAAPASSSWSPPVKNDTGRRGLPPGRWPCPLESRRIDTPLLGWPLTSPGRAPAIAALEPRPRVRQRWPGSSERLILMESCLRRRALAWRDRRAPPTSRDSLARRPALGGSGRSAHRTRWGLRAAASQAMTAKAVKIESSLLLASRFMRT